MTTNQEKILNYLLFFLLSLTGLVSLLLVKNNYLYVFVFVFLVLYWQKESVRQILAKYLKSSPSFFSFLTLGMIGVLLFQVFSRSPRFYQRPILTLIVSLIFYLPYFFLWYKLWLKKKISLLETFFLSGLLGILFFGLLSGKLTNTVLTAPNLAAGLLYTLLKTAGIASVVGSITAFPFLFFSERERTPLAKEVGTKNNSGFGLIEIVVGITVIGVALGMVSAARQKRETVKKQVQTNIEQAAQERSKLEEPTREIPKKEPKADVKKDAPRSSEEPTTDERKEKGPRASSGGKGSSSFDVGSCFPGSPDPACIAIFGEEPSFYYDPYSDPSSPEYQQQLYEQYYYYEQQQQEMFDLNQFMQDPYQQYNPVLQDFYQQMLPDVYQQFFP